VTSAHAAQQLAVGQRARARALRVFDPGERGAGERDAGENGAGESSAGERGAGEMRGG